MRKPMLNCLVVLFAILFRESSFAQQTGVLNLNKAMTDSLVALYRNALGEGNHFYAGTEFIGYVMRPKGHPFFQSERMVFAEISMGGVAYKDSLQYDLVSDALIVSSFDGAYNFRLIKDKVSSFKIKEHVFVRLDATGGSTDIQSGFYEQLYNGPSAVFVKHRKQVNTTTIQGETFSEYVQYDTYFVRKGNDYFQVTSNKSLLDVFGERKAELRKLLREEGLEFKKDPSNTTRKAAEFFDQINK